MKEPFIKFYTVDWTWEKCVFAGFHFCWLKPKKKSKLLLPFDQKVPMKSILMTMVTVNETFSPLWPLVQNFQNAVWPILDSLTTVKLRTQKYVGKVMLIVYFGRHKRLIERLMASFHAMINGQYYADLLTKLRKTVTWKWRISNTQNLHLLQENTLS